MGPLLAIVDADIPPVRSIRVLWPQLRICKAIYSGYIQPYSYLVGTHLVVDQPILGHVFVVGNLRCVFLANWQDTGVFHQVTWLQSLKKRKSSVSFVWRRATVTIHTYRWWLQRLVVSAYVYSYLEEEFHFWRIEFNWVEKPRQLHVDYPWWIRNIIHLVSQNFQKYLFCVRCFLDLGSTFIHKALHGQQM